MNSYSEYKDSGVEWLEQTPIHWNVLRMKNIMSPLEGRSQTGDEELLSVTIEGGVVKRSDYLGNDTESQSRSESLVGYKLVNRTNLVNNIMKMGFRCLGISPYDGMVSPAYSVFSLDSELVYYKYIHQLLRINLFVSEYKKRSKGIQESRMRLYDDYFLDIKVIIPPLHEQILISKYLDKKTSQIDSLIEKTQRKILLLKEQRTSLINQCVTKGLDPNVEMKDSDIEWIGEIPKHWKKVRLKNLFITQFGGSWGNDPEEEQIENLVHVIRVTEFDYENLCISENIPTVRSLELIKNSIKLVSKGDLILEKSGGGDNTPVGRLVLVNKSLISPTINSNFTNLIKIDQTRFVSKYITYIFNTLYMSGVTRRNIKQTTGIQNLDIGGLFIEPVFIPSQKEMEEISIYLDNSTTQILLLIKKETQRINLLKEYRQSLISNVVTGKIRVTEDMI